MIPDGGPTKGPTASSEPDLPGDAGARREGAAASLGSFPSARTLREAVQGAWAAVGNPGAGGRFGPWWLPGPLRAHLQEFISELHDGLSCQAVEFAMARPAASPFHWPRYQLIAGSYRSRSGARMVTEPLSRNSDATARLRQWALGGEPTVRANARLDAFLRAGDCHERATRTVLQRARAALVAAASGLADGERPGSIALMWELFKSDHGDGLRRLGALRARGLPESHVRKALCWMIVANDGDVFLSMEPRDAQLRERASALAEASEGAPLAPGALQDAEELWWYLTACAPQLQESLTRYSRELPLRLFRYLFEAPYAIHAPWAGLTGVTYRLRPWSPGELATWEQDDAPLRDIDIGPYRMRADEGVLEAYRAVLPGLDAPGDDPTGLVNALEIPLWTQRRDGGVLRGYLRVLNTYAPELQALRFTAPRGADARWFAIALQEMVSVRLAQRLPSPEPAARHSSTPAPAPVVAEQVDPAMHLLPDGRVSDFVGISPAVQRIRQQVARYAIGTAPVLITGETGTGKDLLARDVHSCSPRSAGPFFCLEVASYDQPDVLRTTLFGVGPAFGSVGREGQDGLLVRYDGGTLVLDEFARMSRESQLAFLRLVQSPQQKFVRSGEARELTTAVRFVCTTNLDIPAHIDAGLFISDLYFRVTGHQIVIPPLRTRREDVPEIARVNLRRILKEYGMDEFSRILDDSALAYLRQVPYTWPGNGRNVDDMLRSAVHCPDHRITAEYLANMMSELEPMLNGPPDLGKPKPPRVATGYGQMMGYG